MLFFRPDIFRRLCRFAYLARLGSCRDWEKCPKTGHAIEKLLLLHVCLSQTVAQWKPTRYLTSPGEVAIVIGATGALGGALAQGLAEAGAKVAVLGRNTERGEARVKTILDRGGHGAFFEADAVQKESLRSAHKALEKEATTRK